CGFAGVWARRMQTKTKGKSKDLSKNGRCMAEQRFQFQLPGRINILTAPARRQTFVASVRHPSLPRLRRDSPESFWKLDGNGITDPSVHLKRCSRIDLKNVF